MPTDKIETNKLNLNIKEDFWSNYSVFKVATSKELWGVLDNLAGYIASCGIVEEGTPYLYLLDGREDVSRRHIQNELGKLNIPYKRVQESRDVPLKLLVNAVCKEKGYTSLAGRNYLIEGADFFKNGKLAQSLVLPEIEVSKDGVVIVHSVTFVRYKDSYAGVPAFRYKDGKLFRETRPDGDCFVRKGIKDKKATSLAYLDTRIADIEKRTGFVYSRVFLIRRIKTLIEKRFGDLVEISFARMADVIRFAGVSAEKCKNILDENIREHFRHGILSDIPEICEIYNIPNTIGPAIKLIEEKDAYEDGEDEHVSSLDIQHVTRPTYEDARGNSKKMEIIARACLVELAIKQDVAGGVDSFSRSDSLLGGDAVFYIVKNGKYSYVRKRGMVLDFGTFFLATPPKWVPEAVLDAEEEYIISRKSAVIGLRQTELSPLADKAAKSVIEKTKGAVRNKKTRDELFGGILDAHIFSDDRKKYYYSSVIGKGMNPAIPKADTLMELTEYVPCEEYSWLLPYVAVTYINAGNRYTKYPYPFKYLREWIVAKGDKE